MPTITPSENTATRWDSARDSQISGRARFGVEQARDGGISSAILIFIGFNLTFLPQFFMGYLGMPRRYHVYPEEFQIFHVASTAGATIMAAGYILPLLYLTFSLWFGKKAEDNPWGAHGLEWTTSSPPPHENFDETPIVTEEAYAYPEVKKAEVPSGA